MVALDPARGKLLARTQDSAVAIVACNYGADRFTGYTYCERA